MTSIVNNIASVKGFTCWGAHSGVKSMRRDLALIYSEVPASAAAVFTQNKVVAEPVKISREHVKRGKAQAIVCNAGNANACTGEQGMEGARAMVKTTAEELGITESDVIVASTGLIGEPFPTDDIVEGIKNIVPKLSNRTSAGTLCANAILTTDTFAKEGFINFEIGGKQVCMAGIAKGSGMIHPNMATMLSFIVCDVSIKPSLLQEALNECNKKSFNMITVDGDTSTNDMAAVLCNGKANNEEITSKKSAEYKLFKEKLEEMMIHLAKLIVSDGEGASKFVEYAVVNSNSEERARTFIRSISDSDLVKTAMFGRDPNWGRVVAAAGNSGQPFDYTKVDLSMGSSEKQIQVLKAGTPQKYDKNFMKKLLRESNLKVIMDLNEGEESATGWGSDLTTDYVLFNSVYTT